MAACGLFLPGKMTRPEDNTGGMEEKQVESPAKKSLGRRILRILGKALLWIFLLMVTLFLLLLTPPVQNFVTGKLTNFLENKLGTRVEVDRVFLQLNGQVAVDGLFLEDQHGDTLLSARKLRAGVNLWGLIRGSDPDISSVELEGGVIQVHRSQPDTVFNFQYIIDAFASAPDTSTNNDSSGGGAVKLGKILLSDMRLSYADHFTGDEVTVNWDQFSTDLSGLDLEKGRYAATGTIWRGLDAQVRRLPPSRPPPDSSTAAVAVEAVTDTVAANDMMVLLSGFQLIDANIQYLDSNSRMQAGLQSASLRLKDLSMDLNRGIFQFNDVDLGNARLQYNNQQQPRQTRGIDYAHLDARVKDLSLARFYMQGDSLSGEIDELALTEQSGLELNQLRTEFAYGSHSARLSNLELETPDTRIARDIAIQYPSLDSIAAAPERLMAQLDLQDTRIAVNDILLFAPDLASQPLFADRSAVWELNTRLSGTVQDMLIEELALAGPAQTRVQLKGTLRNAMDWKNLQADLQIEEISATRRGVQSFLPAGSMPSSFQLPQRTRIQGALKGSPRLMNLDLTVLADGGSVTLDGQVENLQKPEQLAYQLDTKIDQLDLAMLLKDTATYGLLTARMDLKGAGTDLKSMQSSLRGQVQSVQMMGYTYSGIPLQADLAMQQLHVETGLKDPNLHFAINGDIDLSGAATGVKLTGMIDSAKLQPLGFTASPYIIRTAIDADFNNVDPNALEGRLLLNNLLLVNGPERLNLDEVRVEAARADSGRFLRLQSDIVRLHLQGDYQLTQLGNVIMKEIEPYYALGGPVADPGSYDFTLDAILTDRPLLRALVPGLEQAEGVELHARVADDAPLKATVEADVIAFNGTRIRGLNLLTEPADSALQMALRVGSIQSGGLAMDSTLINARVANNNIDWDALIRDREGRERYQLAGQIQQQNGDLVLQMKPEQLMLNYENWQMSDSNRVVVASNGIWARNFELRNGQQVLRLHSAEPSGTAPLHLSLQQFQAGTLTSLVLSDSSMIDGTLTGEVDLENLNGNPGFSGELEWSNLSYRRDTVGNLTAKFSNAGGGDQIRADLKLSGRGNDVTIDGSYNVKAATLDLRMNLDRLPMTTAEAFAGGSIRQASGYVDGPFRITGPVSGPQIEGDLRFHNAALNIAMLNSYFQIDNETLRFTREGLQFNRFQVKDSAGNNLTIDGALRTRNYSNYDFDLEIRARDFRALNSTKKDNKLFWGQLYFNTNLTVKGNESKPVVDGRLTINEGTKMTVVLPQSEPGVVDRAGVIEFVDMDAPLNDSLFLAAYDSMNMSEITGMDVSMNVTVDKAADFTLIIDEANGDFLNVQGEAQLNAGIDPSGKVTLVGTYDLEQGAYELSFNMLRRKFDIQKGSRIVWEGEPTKANVDITAKYVANTAPLDLVKGQLDENLTAQERNVYLQRLPFDVNLKMTGQLLKPQISFDIILPDNKNYGVSGDVLSNVRTKLEQLRQSPGDMNKQVFSLLLLNRFISENSLNISSSNTSASTMLRQSVSKLLTEQLNRLAEGLVEGVDINFGIESRDDYTTGQRQDRTDLNVGLSKSLLNDRLTVTVGSNFALEGPQAGNQQANNIAGNVAIDYALSSDGRYKLRAYRKNDYQGVIDGYVVETGVSFIITLDYNKFKQIFQKRKNRRRRDADADDDADTERKKEKAPASDQKKTSEAARPRDEND